MRPLTFDLCPLLQYEVLVLDAHQARFGHVVPDRAQVRTRCVVRWRLPQGCVAALAG